jgi:hypothetical protein
MGGSMSGFDFSSEAWQIHNESAFPTGEESLREEAARTGYDIPVRCPCGWDAHGELRLVDQYAAAWPPIPRGRTDWTYVFYDDDPDCRFDGYCPDCETELDADKVVRR